MSFELIDHNRENVREFDTRSEAEAKRKEMIGLGASPEDLEIREAGVESVEPEVVDHTPDDTEDEHSAETARTDGAPPVEEVPESEPPVDVDPVDWMPGHFIDHIDGTPTVNRKGYAVLASKYGVSVESEPRVTAGESGHEYAEFKAVAKTDDGHLYTGFGSAHVDRGDDATLLNELAETRSMKRAVAWATGMGLTAVEELQNEL